MNRHDAEFYEGRAVLLVARTIRQTDEAGWEELPYAQKQVALNRAGLIVAAICSDQAVLQSLARNIRPEVTAHKPDVADAASDYQLFCMASPR